MKASVIQSTASGIPYLTCDYGNAKCEYNLRSGEIVNDNFDCELFSLSRIALNQVVLQSTVKLEPSRLPRAASHLLLVRDRFLSGFTVCGSIEGFNGLMA